MTKKKVSKRIINKARVYEVSLAAFPKNRESWILIKEEEMDKLVTLIANLAQKADVPEVVKEELKEFCADISTDEMADILKEAGVKLPVEEKIIKDEEIQKEFDELKKKYEAEASKAKLLQKEFEKLEKELFKKEISEKVSDSETVDMLVSMVGKVEKDEILKLADKMSGISKLVKDIHGVTGQNDEDANQIIESEIKKIMKEEGIESRADALVILAERKPELVKSLS